jgi:hypothetical protein
MSLDGFIQGSNGEMDWAMVDDEDVWQEIYEMVEPVGTSIRRRVQDGLGPKGGSDQRAALASVTAVFSSCAVQSANCLPNIGNPLLDSAFVASS